MKIAFVNQPIDTILPPFQTSVGACTYGVACALADSCEVVVYGAQDRNPGSASNVYHRNVNFVFFPSTRSDRLLYRARHLCSKLGRLTSPASTSNWLYPEFGRQVALDLQKRGCDVIHIQHFSPYVPVIRALNPTAKIVLHLHAEWFSQNNRPALERRLRNVDLLTGVSDYVRDNTRRAFPAFANRCETTYNGIDAQEFRREKNYEAHGSPRIKRIVYAGAVSPHKGLHVLLEAFKRVAGRYPGVHLDIIGFQGSYSPDETFDLTADRALLASLAQFYAKNYAVRLKARLSLAAPDAGTYLAYLKDQVSPEIADKVTFSGLIPRPDLLERYYAADVFAFPPIWNEGFGIPPVEAMAAGVPVVATRSGAITETVVDGETGFLVDKNDSHGLANSLLALLEDDALSEKMGRAGRKRAMERFTWDQVAHSLRSRYESLCDIHGRTERAMASTLNSATSELAATGCEREIEHDKQPTGRSV
jgi:glycosyltransferase involved in cell wall biosynthesis